ncbi:hypothetical protein N657DRAFT_358099 [Parathielavia appendiculata]|uniref:Uncharacterized protein n=1 Tax=Parathielavia appendiculata TaxID=2587402 RepID=A0AAN6Z5B8_9PEZI|nr:hypothetical protein N657DRAFT_358099 [Parathielavia appendiculata]
MLIEAGDPIHQVFSLVPCPAADPSNITETQSTTNHVSISSARLFFYQLQWLSSSPELPRLPTSARPSAALPASGLPASPRLRTPAPADAVSAGTAAQGGEEPRLLVLLHCCHLLLLALRRDMRVLFGVPGLLLLSEPRPLIVSFDALP